MTTGQLPSDYQSTESLAFQKAAITNLKEEIKDLKRKYENNTDNSSADL